MSNSYRNQTLALAMEAKGLKPKGLAERVGVSVPTAYSWLNGKSPTKSDHRDKLAEVLEVEPEHLTVGDPEPELPNGVSIKISGDGLLLEMQVSKETARKVLHQLLND